MITYGQQSMFEEQDEPQGHAVRSSVPAVSALETSFPAAVISAAGERESWRKEVHRPATHTHKWWAQRLGSVFRGILASAVASDEAEAISNYSGSLRLPGVVVCDPFAGSGTTLAEAAKLGATVVGRDINPVATLVQRQALAEWDRDKLAAAFKRVESKVRKEIDDLHRDKNGLPVLYYFWVALAPCRQCPSDAPEVELFSRYVFSQHAYPKKHPQARATCPHCHAVVTVNVVEDSELTCQDCGRTSSLTGPVNRATMTCRAGHQTKIIDALGDELPGLRMYAKQVLAGDGSRRYEPIDDFDLELYTAARQRLEEKRDILVLPDGFLEHGNNTRQAMRWNYKRWDQYFNARQLYSLGLLGAAIRDLNASPEREALAALFSGVLEFNNLFCSFKGEGTGAVRHMFSNHVLKPERTPLEAHPWGTPASSGSFSTLYQSRIIRALEYKQNPHDLVPDQSGQLGRQFGLSEELGRTLGDAEGFAQGATTAYLSTGSSASFDLPDASVDLVITDPPFMDNVHYSELADFFHAWLRKIQPFEGYPVGRPSTRHPEEVQSKDPEEFGNAIAAVWKECARLLKPHGLLAFTFHQAKVSGWRELVRAIESAGLVITAVQPVKAEMSTSTIKSAAADPSNLDSIVICRLPGHGIQLPETVEAAVNRATAGLRECQEVSVKVGFADVESVVRGSVLALHTIPGNDMSIDALVRAADHEVIKAAVTLGVRSNRVVAESPS
ncbi:DNA methyltransferase [Streptomyces malaysiensis]|uniref:DNA methyltransferase n=1 Tax=Streptomyces malaysiensis TaxID=92644 RepID=UPI0036AFB4A8